MKQPIDPTGIARRKVERIGGRGGDELDAVVVEEPLEIRVDGETIGVTMRTPGDDARLALGFLYGEGILRALADVGSVSHCGKPGHAGYGNVIEVRSGPGVSLDVDRILEGRRFLPTSSACGVCGRQSIDDLVARCGTIVGGATLGSGQVLRAVERMRQQQARFERTGGVHAAAAFDAAGELLCCYEDVGRHNAVDKVVGQLLHLGRVGDDARHPAPALLVVSGRAGFEIVQKAAAARIAIVASVSAPTSLSIDLAARAGITLVGFARGDSLNVYTHPWRVRADDPRPRLRAIPGAQGDGDEAPPARANDEPKDDDTIQGRLRNSRLAEELGRLAATLAASGSATAPEDDDDPLAQEPAAERAPAALRADGAVVPASPPAQATPATPAAGAPGASEARSPTQPVPAAATAAPPPRPAAPVLDVLPGARGLPPLAGPRIPGDASWEDARFGAPPAQATPAQDPEPSPAARRLAEAAEAAHRRRAEAEARRQAAEAQAEGDGRQAPEPTPVPFAHLVPDATRGAIIVTAREQAQAEARRRSLAAELLERTDRMLQRKRGGGAPGGAEEFDPFDLLEERWRAGLAGDATSTAIEADLQPEPSWSTLRGRGTEEEESRAVLIDDRDPGNPAPVFWPRGSAGSGS